MALTKDPVCGMDVDPGRPAARHEHDGRTYYFCCEGCRDLFGADPEKYSGMPTPDRPRPSSAAAPAAAWYTCPMHPEVVRDGPGACPICGISLEPVIPSLQEEDDPELKDMTRRLWIGLALRSEEHTSELQSQSNLVCRLLLEKKKKT